MAPTLLWRLLALLVVGFCSIRFTALGNATLQLESSAEMRGTGDGPLDDGVSRLDPDRWAAHWLGWRARRPALGACRSAGARPSPPLGWDGGSSRDRRLYMPGK